MDKTAKRRFLGEAERYRKAIELLESFAASQQSDESQEDMSKILSSRWGSGFLQARSLILALPYLSADDEYKDVLDALRRTPPVWSCFEVISREEDELYLIEDALYPGEQKLLYAPELDHKAPYLCSLLADTGSMLMTHGTAVPIYSLLPDDFRFFLSGFGVSPGSPIEFTSEVLTRFPEFISLLDAADKELDACKDGVIRHYGRHLDGGLDAFADILESLNKQELNEIIRYQYLGPDEESQDQLPWIEPYRGEFPPVFYADTRTSSLYLMTSCREDMIMMCSQLEQFRPELSIDSENYEHSAYPHVISLCNSFHDFSVPWDHYEKPFMDQVDLTLGRLSKYFTLLTEELAALNEDKDYDRKSRCEQLGVDFQTFEQYRNRMLEKEYPYEVEEQDRPFELEHLKAPDPSLMEYFEEPLEDTVLFTIDNSRENVQLFLQLAGYANFGKIDMQHITETIEDLFAPEFDHMDLYVMNGFFYLLLQSEGRWHPLRSYAVEMMKLFGNSFLDDLDMDDEEFVRTLSNCVVRRLLPMGILEAKERPKGENRYRGTYLVKPSSFLTKFLCIKDVHG